MAAPVLRQRIPGVPQGVSHNPRQLNLDRATPPARRCTVNSLFVLLDIESWKPYLTVLLLPPLPLLLLALLGARLLMIRRGLGWLVIFLSVSLLWLSACTGTGRWLASMILRPPPAMSVERIAELKAMAQRKAPVTILVLGGGSEPNAPEYRMSNLTAQSLERLHYGLWLSRETGLPLGFSGGVGWGQRDSVPEAQIAARIAAQDFGRPLKWIEDRSRDTHENSVNSMALIKQAGTRHVVLVTHGWHMPRAMRAFQRASGGSVSIEAAPMGLSSKTQASGLEWMPSTGGYTLVHNVLRELAGRALGA
jgi:uncharacterized SAM-binding protein YcdF (DUF218 family)